MRLLWPALALWMTGCTLLVSTSDLDNGPLAATRDGGGDASRSTLSDADAVKEAGADVSFDAYAPFCSSLAPKPFLCFDFSEAAFDATKWDEQMLTDGTVAVESDTFVAMTNATGGAFRPAFVQKNIGGTKTTFRIAADVRVEKAEAVSDSQLGARFLGLKAGVNLFVGIRDKKVVVVENWGSDGATKSVHGSGPYPEGAWFHIALTFDLAAKRVDVTLDGTKISDGTPLAGPVDTSKTIAAVVGLYYPSVNAEGFTVRYDNVVIDNE